MISSFARNMPEGGKILCVNRPICLPLALFKDRKRLIKRMNESAVQKQSGNLYTYTPIVYIHDQIASRTPIVRVLQRWRMQLHLRRIMSELGFASRVRLSWIYNPWQKHCIGLAGEVAYIYECYDAYSEFGSALMGREEIRKTDEEMARGAMAVFATAKKLYADKVKLNENCWYIPNAVDSSVCEHTRASQSVPDGMKSISRPIVGFVGHVDDCFIDCDLLEYLATSNPAISFVFIGDIRTNARARALWRMHNVRALGYRKYEELPGYLAHFDVGIMPFRRNRITESLCPLKLYEYMAAGCPTVSTTIPEVAGCGDLISIAETHEGFDALLKKAVETGKDAVGKRLIEESRHHTWDNRTPSMITHIGVCIKESNLMVS